MKACRKCGELKPLDDFEKDSRLKSGRGGRCRPCAQNAVRIWARNHPEKHYEYIKTSRQRNPEIHRQYNRARWARRHEADGIVLDRDWIRLVARYGGKCAYCGMRPGSTQDHVIPLIAGGRHTIGNVLPACQSCNSSKRDRFLVEWKARQAETSVADLSGAVEGRRG